MPLPSLKYLTPQKHPTTCSNTTLMNEQFFLSSRKKFKKKQKQKNNKSKTKKKSKNLRKAEWTSVKENNQFFFSLLIIFVYFVFLLNFIALNYSCSCMLALTSESCRSPFKLQEQNKKRFMPFEMIMMMNQRRNNKTI